MALNKQTKQNILATISFIAFGIVQLFACSLLNPLTAVFITIAGYVWLGYFFRRFSVFMLAVWTVSIYFSLFALSTEVKKNIDLSACLVPNHAFPGNDEYKKCVDNMTFGQYINAFRP